MSLLLVLTVATLALVDAGYQYNAPNIFFRLAAQYQTENNSYHHTGLIDTYDKSISYKNNDYVKKDNGYQSHVPGFFSNNDYLKSFPQSGGNLEGHSVSLTPTVNLHNNAEALEPARYRVSSGLVQPLCGTKNCGSINSGYSQTSSLSGTNLNIGSRPPATSNLNTDYDQLPTSNATPAPTSANFNINLQTIVQNDRANLNTARFHTLTPFDTNSMNNGYTQSGIPPASSNLITGYSSSLAPPSSGGLVQGYAPTADRIVNTGYPRTSAPASTQSFPPFSSSSYSQTSIPSAWGYPETLLPSVSDSAHSSNSQSSTSQAAINIYKPPATLSSGHAQTHASYIDSNLNTGYTQNLLPQSLTSVISASLNSDFNKKLTGSANGNLNAILNSRLNTISSPTGASVAPVILKHIYFHLPPAEVEEQKVIPPSPPIKKNYKIIFIKLPSLESNTNSVRLQQLIQMRDAAAAAREDKTLIYVLVKNTEHQSPVVAANHKLSKHEVFFVKYNGNTLNIASQVNEKLDESGSVLSAVRDI